MKTLFKLFSLVVIVALFAACAPQPTWTQSALSYAYDVVKVEDEKWEMPRETHFATDLSQGRYDIKDAVISSPEKGYCAKAQRGCPPHLAIYRFTVTDSALKGVMEIPTRIKVGMTAGSEEADFRLQWMYNPNRTSAELMQDYAAAASDGQLGLFLSTADGIMPEGTLTWNGEKFEFGYSCWDCLAHTRGPKDPQPVLLDTFGISHFGTPTAPRSSTFTPGIVIPIPTPADQPDFSLDLMVHVPAGTQIYAWLGRYDVTSP